MSRNLIEIRKGIQELCKGRTVVYIGKVISVDEQHAVCEVQLNDNGLQLPVMLRATVDGLSGIVIIPAIGSEIVFCAIETDDDYTIVRASKVEKLLIDVPELQIKCPKLIINNGDNGEMVKIKALEDNIDSLKKMVEAMHRALPGAFKAILASTSANGALGEAAYNASMSGQRVTIKDMKDKNVKH